MNYNEFKNRTQKLPVIFSQDVLLFGKNRQAIRNQLRRWCAKKLLVKLRRGMFILNPHDRKINPSRMFIANQLYGPSYVSLEYALGYYGLIPERVSDLTSVTTKKTLRLANETGTYIYQHVKGGAFRGFKALKDESALSFFIAEPEKAIVDFLYLNLEKFHGNSDDLKIFEGSYRLQNVDTLTQKKVMGYAGLFGNGKLKRVSRNLCIFIKKESKR